MRKRSTPAELIQNAVYSVEAAAHRVRNAPHKREVRRRARLLRRAVDTLEDRVLAALAVASSDAG